MSTYHYSYQQLNDFCMEVFRRMGFTDADAAVISDVLLLADLYGIESHGMQRMEFYRKRMQSGKIKMNTKPEIVFETPVSAIIDGHEGMGHPIAHMAMKLAIEKAKKSGIAIVSVRSSNHFGIAGYYARMALKEGLMGVAMTNSEAIMVPTFARTVMIGSNPIAIAFPADPTPFVFDASTTVVTRGKLEVYNKLEKPLADGWALDKNGQPSTDANDVLYNIFNKIGGGIMPLGGNTEQLGSHKGYGYGMLCELFCSIFSMGATSNHVNTTENTGTCHGFMVVDPKIFGDPDAIKAHLSAYLQELRDAPKAEGCPRIYTHGEKEAEAYALRMKNGLDVLDKTVSEMYVIAQELGMDAEKYLGKVDVCTFTTNFA